MRVNVKKILKDEKNIQLIKGVLKLTINVYIILYIVKSFSLIMTLLLKTQIFSIASVFLFLYLVLLILFGVYIIFKKNNLNLMFIYMLAIQVIF